jgi:uncharacterized repeat protein (TIGR01451 family)
MKQYNVVTLFIFFLLSYSKSYSQSLLWAKQLAGPSSKIVNDVAVDKDGSVYTVGLFKEVIDFDPGPSQFNLTPVGAGTFGSADIFISKLDSSGNFVWAKLIGGSGTDRAATITCDNDGNIYVSGEFRNTVDFDPGPGTNNLTSLNADLFILKLNSSGELIFVKQIANSGAREIEIDNSGNIILACTISSPTVDFDPGVGIFNLNSKGYSDIAICKFTSTGNFVWAKQVAGSLDDLLSTIKIDADNSVILIGAFLGTCDFDPGPGTFNLTSFGSSDAFIAKLDGAGNFIWAKQVGGSEGQNLYGIGLDESGNIILSGYSEGTGDFDPGLGVLNLFGANDRDFVLMKLDKQGGLVWAKLIASNTSEEGDALILDKQGNIIVAGSFTGTVDFDTSPAVASLTTVGAFDIFICQFTSSGIFRSVKQIGGKDFDACRTIISDKNENLYMIGTFQSTVDFDLGPKTYNLTNTTPILSTDADIFIAKYGRNNKMTGITFFDENHDGVQQKNEPLLPNVPVNAVHKGILYQVTSDSSGIYTIDADTGAYSITVPPLSHFLTTKPLAHSADFGSSHSQYDTDNDFGLQPIPGVKDLRVALTNVMAVRRGFNTLYHLTYQNVGTVTLSGNVVVSLDSALTLISSFPIQSNYTYPKITYNFSDLKPYQTVDIDMLLGVAQSTSLGRIIKSIAVINPIPGDIKPENNTDTLYNIVTGSFDPNDKSVFPQGSITPSFISKGTYLDYTIRFQNTGNDTAFTVVIRDTISNNLDPASIQLISASHSYTTAIEKGNIFEWRFNNILLPDSNRNEIKSHGFIRYQIKPKNILIPGDQIKNRAAIYFDFNAPVITNETNTIVKIIADTTASVDSSNLVNIQVFPNPAGAFVNVKTKGPFEYAFFNSSGQIIISPSTANNEISIDTKRFQKGMYVLWLKNSYGTYSYKIIIQ